MSILPRVEASIAATPVRAARHSREHGRVHVLAGQREVAGPLPLADVLEHRAPCATCRSCSAVVRTGSEQHRRGPARRAWRTTPACTAGGTWSCRRRRVGAEQRGDHPAGQAPEVLPWSAPVPAVVYRLTCSTERIPAPSALAMSATVTSRCRSTNACRCAARPARARPVRARGRRLGRAVRLGRLGGAAPGRATRAARPPGRRPRSRPRSPRRCRTGRGRRRPSARPGRTGAGTYACRVVVEAQPALGLAEQVHGRVPAAGHREQVGRDVAGRRIRTPVEQALGVGAGAGDGRAGQRLRPRPRAGAGRRSRRSPRRPPRRSRAASYPESAQA